jgi:hypothetical protein
LALSLGSLFRYPVIMTDAIADIRNKRGRPKVGSTGVLVKFTPSQLAALDGWIAAQDDKPSRPEAVRRILAVCFQGRDIAKSSAGSA